MIVNAGSRILDLEECPHSSEAYYSNVYLDASTLIIPYINFGLIEHPLALGRAAFIDFSYLVCLEMHYLKVHTGVLVGRREDAGRVLHFGGLQMDAQPELVDFEVSCRHAYLQLLSDSQIVNHSWVAADVPSRNLDTETIMAFFRGDRMPESVRRLMVG